MRAGCLDVAGSYGPDGDGDVDGDVDACDGEAWASASVVSAACDTDGDAAAGGAVSADAASSLSALQAANPVTRMSVSPVAVILRLSFGMIVPLKHVTVFRN